MEVANFTVIERLDDGRLLVEPDGRAGVLVVVGTSAREPAAARMGNRRGRTPATRGGPGPPPEPGARGRTPATTVRHRPPPRHAGPAPREARAQEDAAEAKAQELFISLLDDGQREQWRRYGRCWVETPKGPVRLGRLHDLRFRPRAHPGEEWSLCVVPSGPPMPMADVWTNLLLALSADPAGFFAVADVRAKALTPTAPHPPAVHYV